jgi:hypothetical protein
MAAQLELRLPGTHKCGGDFDLRAGDKHPLLGSNYGDGRKIVCVRTTDCERNSTPWTWVCPEFVKDSGDPHPFDWAVLPEQNEELAVDIALDILCSQGWVDPEFLDHPDEPETVELLEELKRLYREGHELGRQRIYFREGDSGHNFQLRHGEWLALAWQHEQRLKWEREQAPRFECEFCGTVLGADEIDQPRPGMRSWALRPCFYTLNDDGEFAEQVKACPGCGRDLNRMLTNDGQLEISDEQAAKEANAMIERGAA